MDPSQIPLWRCFSSSVPPKPPRNILHFLSQLRFDGKGEISASKHGFNFYKFCGSHNITNRNIICRLFTLTFVVWVKIWCETLLSLFTHWNNLCVNFCMILRVIVMIICVNIYWNWRIMRMNLLNILSSDLAIFDIDFLWNIGPLKMIPFHV
jgi:hypothetical protein